MAAQPIPFPIAQRVLARFGSSLAEAERSPDGQSNMVWLAPSVVLRMGPKQAGRDGSLLREAALAALLPGEAGYPAVLGSGLLDGWEWVVAERLPGDNLVTAWPSLDDASRCAALADLWARLAAIHRTDIVQARRLGCTTTPFYALEPQRAARQLRVCREAGAVDTALAGAIERVLGSMYRALAGVPLALAHTDAGAANTVWDGRHAVPIDYEFACVAPVDLDVENMARSFAAEPDSPFSRQLAQLARAELARNRARERLLGYAVLRDVWGLTKWLGNAIGGDDRETWQPLLNLRAHVAGTSWVARLWS